MAHENTISDPNAADEQGKDSLVRSVFIPMLLIVLTLLWMAGLQTSELFRENHKLVNSRSGQDKAVEDSQKVRSQFNSIAKGTAQLAAQGDQNAILLLKQLKALGVTVSQSSK